MRRAIPILAIVVVLILLNFSPSAAFAAPQHKKGGATLSGIVIGPNDKPVPHATISYQSSAGMAPHATRADSRGLFTISKLRADNYDIRASSKGVFSEWEKNVSLRAGESRSITLRLIYARAMPKSAPSKKP